MLCLTTLLAACDRASPQPQPLAPRSALGGDLETGFARADAVRPFVFPRDHGPHPDFRTEWWYVTGHLHSSDERRFGFELTLFRNALTPSPARGSSAWRTRQVYMGHFAVTDIDRQRFLAYERFSRAALGLAGAEADPLRVWVEDWRIDRSDANGPFRLSANADGAALRLSLEPLKAPVLQGDRGLSRKGPEPGNASYYYSLTRLTARGTLRLSGEDMAVDGQAWLDREWSTSALGPHQSGWDWFALQLADGRELMFYRMRRDDGVTDPHSAGSLVAADGAVRYLDHDDLLLEELEHWTSPHSGVTYPARWRLRVPDPGLDLTLTPLLADQELNLTVRYWEGAVRVTGSAEGLGYVELAGYEP